MRTPEEIRQCLREKLWTLADGLDWPRLSWYEKSAHYEAWTKDRDVGGLLSNYMDHRRIRVYIKDTLMKGYTQSLQASPTLPFKTLNISKDIGIAEEYEQPHGRRLTDGRVVAWGRAGDWKLVLMAVHERSHGVNGARPYATVLMFANGKYYQPQVREMVQDAADKLGIEHLLWLP